jgi:hypothetical protein
MATIVFVRKLASIYRFCIHPQSEKQRVSVQRRRVSWGMWMFAPLTEAILAKLEGLQPKTL